MYNGNYDAVYCRFIMIFKTKPGGDDLCRPLARRRPRPVARGNATALRLCCSSNCETLPATTDPLRNPVEVLLHTVMPPRPRPLQGRRAPALLCFRSAGARRPNLATNPPWIPNSSHWKLSHLPSSLHHRSDPNPDHHLAGNRRFPGRRPLVTPKIHLHIASSPRPPSARARYKARSPMAP